jgi:hypothetical protein
MYKEKYAIGIFVGFYTPSRVSANGTVYQTCWVKFNDSLLKVNIFGEHILGALRVGTKLKLSVTKPTRGTWENCEFISAELLNPVYHRALPRMNFTLASGFEIKYGLSK